MKTQANRKAGIGVIGAVLGGAIVLGVIAWLVLTFISHWQNGRLNQLTNAPPEFGLVTAITPTQVIDAFPATRPFMAAPLAAPPIAWIEESTNGKTWYVYGNQVLGFQTGTNVFKDTDEWLRWEASQTNAPPMKLFRINP